MNLPGPIVTLALRVASKLGALVSPMLVDGKKVERIRNVPYGDGESQVLDLYRLRERPAKVPVALFIHGGGFRYFSKESHAAAAARLAESGRLVFCIDYRLTPKNPFPAGLVDALAAYGWLVKNAGAYGGDLDRISLIGESSGANYVLSLCLYLFGLRELDAKNLGPGIPVPKPKAAIAHCGYFEVADIDRFRGDPRTHSVARTRVAQIRRSYLPEFRDGGKSRPEWALADPLLVLREMNTAGTALPKGFPDFFVPVGERDPVIGDSERLAQELAKLGQKDRLRVYPGVGHAFYAFPSTIQAKRCWTDIIAFLESVRA